LQFYIVFLERHIPRRYTFGRDTWRRSRGRRANDNSIHQFICRYSTSIRLQFDRAKTIRRHSLMKFTFDDARSRSLHPSSTDDYRVLIAVGHLSLYHAISSLYLTCTSSYFGEI